MTRVFIPRDAAALALGADAVAAALGAVRPRPWKSFAPARAACSGSSR